MKKYYKAFIFAALFATPAHAEIASVDYVNNLNATNVSTLETANQQMAGTYTVTGALIVPTPDLPSAD
ncbi:MAG: hypothetical protein R8M70_00980 [Alphaproteobacteria bacterium]|nr:hypothetical protein [Alphaproteobacteria bacterium]